MENGKIMFQAERQERILEYINTNKKVRTKELSRIFNTSMVTIRADLNDLDEKGMIIKAHGGAMAISDRLNLEIPSQSKSRHNLDAKRAIARQAADLVKENDVVILDAGSTTLEIAKLIKNKAITVITNDLKIGVTLAPSGSVTLIMTGGTVEPMVYTLCGMETVEFLRGIKANKMFLGCDAVDPRKGVSNRTLLEVGVKKAMIQASEQVIAVADGSKHGKQVFAHVCDASDLDVLVTDRIPRKEKEALEKLGVEVVVNESMVY